MHNVHQSAGQLPQPPSAYAGFVVLIGVFHVALAVSESVTIALSAGAAPGVDAAAALARRRERAAALLQAAGVRAAADSAPLATDNV